MEPALQGWLMRTGRMRRTVRPFQITQWPKQLPPQEGRPSLLRQQPKPRPSQTPQPRPHPQAHTQPQQRRPRPRVRPSLQLMLLQQPLPPSNQPALQSLPLQPRTKLRPQQSPRQLQPVPNQVNEAGLPIALDKQSEYPSWKVREDEKINIYTSLSCCQAAAQLTSDQDHSVITVPFPKYCVSCVCSFILSSVYRTLIR